MPKADVGSAGREGMMDPLWDENRPQSCLKVGLDCRSCVQGAAATVASLCPGLSSPTAEKLFVQIFSSPGCAPMAPVFATMYAEADPGPRTPGLTIVVAA